MGSGRTFLPRWAEIGGRDVKAGRVGAWSL